MSSANAALWVGIRSVLIATLLAGCAEAVRWPDRMNGAPARRMPEPLAVPEGSYLVRPGDTVYSIAFRNQLDPRDLAVWNDIGPDYLIHPGQILHLTAPEAGTARGGSGIVTTPMRKPSPRTTEASAAAPARREPEAKPLPANYRWQWPTQGSVVKPFGGEGAGGKGIDIGGTLGQPVVAAAPGKVVYSGSALKGYGELIIIKHDDVHLSAYGYNRKRLVDEGMTVAAGQPIAELGFGPEQKPVLHFEIRNKGKPVDPADVLPHR
jgi:lipoprotein NlpD